MLGVCYYPEHWPRERWAEDAQRMKALGLTYVRIGEFAWSCLEPDPGHFTWEWLDEAIETLGRAGLRVVLGTPTATPPKWLIDQHPEILGYDAQGRPRKFGSRRHYSFSSRVYREEARRIVTLLAQRYGQNPFVAGWQTDNEYGCHDTTRSYGPEDLRAFRLWLQARYGHIEALNRAWGNVFWSMAYRSFDEIDLPNQTVTEANPSHWLDFFRFSSDQVAAFNRMQVEILRQHSPGRFILHNFMGYTPDFDHFKLAQDLDIAGWDSYPLGFTDMDVLPCTPEEKLCYAHTGHPDMAAFHHDLYRGVKPRWWVMEQQPGPVNWAHHNPSPAPGMVRLWTWEALAHGAEVVSYFRWRQFPQAQEQFHAGLNRPDLEPDPGFYEAQQVARELHPLSLPPSAKAPVALVFDYEADWVYRIQPQGQGFVYRGLVWHFYQALRRLGLDVDMLPPWGQPGALPAGGGAQPAHPARGCPRGLPHCPWHPGLWAPYRLQNRGPRHTPAVTPRRTAGAAAHQGHSCGKLAPRADRHRALAGPGLAGGGMEGVGRVWPDPTGHLQRRQGGHLPAAEPALPGLLAKPRVSPALPGRSRPARGFDPANPARRPAPSAAGQLGLCLQLQQPAPTRSGSPWRPLCSGWPHRGSL